MFDRLSRHQAAIRAGFVLAAFWVAMKSIQSAFMLQQAPGEFEISTIDTIHLLPEQKLLNSSSRTNIARVPVPKQTTSAPRILVPKQTADEETTVVICAIIKNEYPLQVQEWSDYNLGLGVKRIYLYDNSEDFNLKLWWDQYQEKTRISLVHHPGEAQQRTAYRLCGERAKAANHTYIFFIDVDEFLVLYQHRNIVDFAELYAKKGHLAIHWRIFGTSGRALHRPLPVTLRFQCKAEDAYPAHSRLPKVLTRAEYLDVPKIDDVHNMPSLYGKVLRAMDGTRLSRPRQQHLNNPAYLYHFFYKSKEEFILKRERGSVFRGKNKTSHLAKLVNAKKGRGLFDGNVFDDEAWNTLKRNVPEYAKYEKEAKNLTWPCKNTTQQDATAALDD